jgi:DNA-binding MarR family transcriptional regulator
MADEPIKDADVAMALGVTPAQAKAWLKRLLKDQLIEKSKKPTGYVASRRRLI